VHWGAFNEAKRLQQRDERQQHPDPRKARFVQYLHDRDAEYDKPGREPDENRDGVRPVLVSKMDAQDIGPTVTRIWGDDDYEFWVRVPPASLPKLAFELLCEKFSGQLGAVDAFRDWCITHGVQHEFDSWI
jgi:hypothetical protein